MDWLPAGRKRRRTGSVWPRRLLTLLLLLALLTSRARSEKPSPKSWVATTSTAYPSAAPWGHFDLPERSNWLDLHHQQQLQLLQEQEQSLTPPLELPGGRRPFQRRRRRRMGWKFHSWDELWRRDSRSMMKKKKKSFGGLSKDHGAGVDRDSLHGRPRARWLMWPFRGRRGTMLSFRRPTPERIAQWFGASLAVSASCPPTFNHQSVGLTNPHVRILGRRSSLPSTSSTTTSAVDSTLDTSSELTPSSLSATSGTGSSSSLVTWWPETACALPDEADGVDSMMTTVSLPSRRKGLSTSRPSSSSSSSWRVMRYRQQVGQGWDCYQRVRDAALAWEFASSPSTPYGGSSRSCGMMAVHRPGHEGRHQELDPTTHGRAEPGPVRPGRSTDHDDNKVMRLAPPDRDATLDAARQLVQHHQDPAASFHQVWSGPGPRSLITYTSTAILSWPPWRETRAASGSSSSSMPVRLSSWRPKRALLSLFALNPVAVVYDVLDQPGPEGSLYSASAYATCPGHWLRGEERVAVIWRPQGQVDVEIISISQPAGRIARWIWPRLHPLQHDFFQQQMESLQQRAFQAGPAIDGPTRLTTPTGKQYLQ